MENLKDFFIKYNLEEYIDIFLEKGYDLSTLLKEEESGLNEIFEDTKVKSGHRRKIKQALQEETKAIAEK